MNPATMAQHQQYAMQHAALYNAHPGLPPQGFMGGGPVNPTVTIPSNSPGAAGAVGGVPMPEADLVEFWQGQTEKCQIVTNFKSHRLPLARIKKIMKKDEDVRMIAAEAPVLFAKACELFVLELSKRTWLQTEHAKRKTMQRQDIALAIGKADMFDFLIDIVPREEFRLPSSVPPTPGVHNPYTQQPQSMIHLPSYQLPPPGGVVPPNGSLMHHPDHPYVAYPPYPTMGHLSSSSTTTTTSNNQNNTVNNAALYPPSAQQQQEANTPSTDGTPTPPNQEHNEQDSHSESSRDSHYSNEVEVATLLAGGQYR